MKDFAFLILKEEGGVQSWSWSKAWSHWTVWFVWFEWFSFFSSVLLGSEFVGESAPPSLLFSFLESSLLVTLGVLWVLLVVFHLVVSEWSVATEVTGFGSVSSEW